MTPKTSRVFAWPLIVPVLACASACGLGGTPTARLSTADDIRSWSSASAPAVYATALGAFNPTSTTHDPACPSVTTSGETQTYTGNCTDSHGVEWKGTAQMVGAVGMRAASVTLNGFGRTSMVQCNGSSVPNTETADGTVTTSQSGDTVSFTIGLSTTFDRPVLGACTTRESGTGTVLYSGTFRSNGSDPTTWNGSGDVGDSLRGQVHAVTSAEVIDHASCETEALSGSTTLSAGGHTAVITYDGASDCTMDSTVTWSLDGNPQGVVSGVACSAGLGPGRAGMAPAVVLGVLAAAGCLARRRVRATRQP
jgi:hypothetical protein